MQGESVTRIVSMLIFLASVINKFSPTNTQSSASEDWTSFVFILCLHPSLSLHQDLKPAAFNKHTRTHVRTKHRRTHTYIFTLSRTNMQIVYTTQQSILYNKTVSHTHINAHKQTLPQMCRTNTRTHSRLCKQLCTYFHMQLVACVQVPPRFIFIVIPNPCSSVKDTFS